MINIVCVKWGDKFHSDHVNRLHDMVKKNLTLKYNFICYTNNANELNRNIIIEPLPGYDLDKWWWKLFLFKNSTKVPTIYFDLDVVIQNNFDHFVFYTKQDKITTIDCIWKTHKRNMKPEPPNYDMSLNSSIMIWKGDLSNVWQEFYSDNNYYMLKYKGIDSYLYFNHYDKLNWLPSKEVYSRKYGIDEHNYYIDGQDFKGFFYSANHTVCIFNGWNRYSKWVVLDDKGYEDYEKYWI